MPTPPDPFGSPRSAERIRTPLAMRAEWAAGSRTGLAWVLVALAGCASQPGPQPPNLSGVGSAYRHSAAEEASALDAATWKGFGDPALERLIARARAANLDVRVAAQRLREARAGSTATSSRLWPTLSAGGSVSDQRTGLPDVVKQNSPDTRAVRGTLDLGWELDVFGAARAAADAAEFDALAAEAGVAVAQWQVSTEVARQYIVWQGARAQLQQLTALVQAQQDTERLTRSRQAAGLASRFDVSRAAGEAQALAAQLPPLRTRVAVTENLLHVLLGLGPAEALPELDPATPAALPEVPAPGGRTAGRPAAPPPRSARGRAAAAGRGGASAREPGRPAAALLSVGGAGPAGSAAEPDGPRAGGLSFGGAGLHRADLQCRPAACRGRGSVGARARRHAAVRARGARCAAGRGEQPRRAAAGTRTCSTAGRRGRQPA